MHCDSFFAIGRTHSVCQDYAAHAVDSSGNPFVMVSDGCSDSPHTDIGARLLVRSAMKTGMFRDMHVPMGAIMARDHLGLQSSCLDATLLRIVVDDGVAITTVAGDGVVAVRRRLDHQVIAWSIEYPSGAPYYLSYEFDADRQAQYVNQFGTFRDVRAYGHEHFEDGVVIDGEMRGLKPRRYTFEREHFDVVMIATDGLHTFRQDGRPYPLRSILQGLFAIKTFPGVFVQRRCKAYLRELAKEGIHHDDDIGIGMMYLGDCP